ncbi:MAG: alpha/beta fold hydrolase [Bacteroidota bacterium]
MSTIKTVIVIGLVVYLLLALAVYVFQERFIFLGEPISQDHVYSFRAPFEEQRFEMPDGGEINSLYFEAEDPKGVVFYHHGNGGELPRWGEVSYFFLNQGYDFFIYDYRGYGKSTGKRSEKALLDDAQILYERLTTRWSEEQIVVYGRSLGSGPASYVAGRNHPVMLILETPFFSLQEMAARYFPFLPSGQLVRYRFPNSAYLSEARTEIHIFHGTEDQVVPYESGHRLFEALSKETAHFYTVEGANHGNLLDFVTYRAGITRILAELNQSE